jgi:hypothetical protein
MTLLGLRELSLLRVRHASWAAGHGSCWVSKALASDVRPGPLRTSR